MFDPNTLPTAGGAPEMSRSSQTSQGGQSASGSSLSEQDLAVLKAAFTPQVLSVLQRLGDSGSMLGQAETGLTEMGAMSSTPPSAPGVAMPTTQLGRMG